MTATDQPPARWCDHHVFFHRIRPFLTGWPAPGLRFAGVDREPLVRIKRFERDEQTAKGTGGSDFVSFLKRSREETTERLLP